MEAKLYGQNKGGMSINGIIKDYYAYAGEKISAGDLVEYVNGVAGKTDYGESVDTAINTSTMYTAHRISAVQLDENKVFIAHSHTKGSLYLYGVVCVIEGATITFGVDTQLSTTSYSGSQISAVVVGENRIFIAHSSASSSTSSNHLYGMVVTIDGTTITVETDTKLSTSAYGAFRLKAKLISADTVFIAHSYASTYQLYGLVCTINGTTITAGNDTALLESSYASATISLEVLPNGNVFIAHSKSDSYYIYGLVCTINGTTITKGPNTAILSKTNAGQVIATQLLPNGNVFIVHCYSSGTSYMLYGIVVTINGTTITLGTDIELSNIAHTGNSISLHLLNNGEILILHSYGDNYYLYGMIVSVEGTTIAVGTDTQLLETDFSGRVTLSLLLDNGTIFTAHSVTTNYYLYAQIFGIDEANNIPTNNVVAIEYETQVRKVTTGQFDGIAKTSGLGGDDTGHKDIVSIWTKVPVVTQEFAMADGKQLCDANGDIFLVREAS